MPDEDWANKRSIHHTVLDGIKNKRFERLEHYNIKMDFYQSQQRKPARRSLFRYGRITGRTEQISEQLPKYRQTSILIEIKKFATCGLITDNGRNQVNGMNVIKQVPKYELVTSHTARQVCDKLISSGHTLNAVMFLQDTKQSSVYEIYQSFKSGQHRDVQET